MSKAVLIPSHSARNRKRKQRQRNSWFCRRPLLELLEERRLLAGDIPDAIARLDGQAEQQDVVPIQIRAQDFDLPDSAVSLGFLLSADADGTFDPQPIAVREVGTGTMQTPLHTAADVVGGQESLALFRLAAGDYELLVSTGNAGQDLTYQVSTLLVGDMNGNRSVDGGDVLDTLLAFGGTDAEALAAGDANLDGTVNRADYDLVRTNLGVSTTIGLSASITATRDGQTFGQQIAVRDDQPFMLAGTTDALAEVAVDIDGDGKADETTAAADDGTFEIDLSFADTGIYALEITRTTPLGVSSLGSFVVDVEESFRITSLSPAAGERMVSPARKVTVRFSEEVLPETVDGDAVQVVANGVVQSGKLIVSSTNRFATFFPDNPWPASTEIRVNVFGDQIVAANGDVLDGDGNGTSGGTRRADFRTLPLTRITGTNVFGFVRDSISQNAVEGVTIRLHAFPEVFAVTDASGRFELTDVPAPEFFVTIDGSTATSPPAGRMYPTLGKPFHSVPGQTVQLAMAGEPFDIFLPAMSPSDVQTLSATESTGVGFGDAARADLAAMFPAIDPAMWDAMQVTFAAGTAQDDQGNVANEALVIPVPADRLPAPLPPGIDAELIVSIQAGTDGNLNAAGGATRFDVPAPITLPNVDNLPPGNRQSIISFDHDAGEWIVVGGATVSADGMSVVSDDGVGILAPGWHGSGPPPYEPPPPRPEQDDDGCDRARDSNQCKSNDGPLVEFFRYLMWLALKNASGGGGSGGRGFPTDNDPAIVEVLSAYVAGTYSALLLTPPERFPTDGSFPSTGNAIADQFIELADELLNIRKPFALTGQEIPAAEQQQIDALLAEIGALTNDDPYGIVRQVQLGLELDLQSRGFSGPFSDPPAHPVKYAAIIKNGSTLTTVRGETEANGQYRIFAADNASVIFVAFYDPASDSAGWITDLARRDLPHRLPGFFLEPITDEDGDFDGDGLDDAAEFVLGTSLTVKDTDGDGILDGAEVEQGLDPLGGVDFPTGLIADLPLIGGGKDLAVVGTADGQLAYVATGSHGTAIVDASQFNNPIVLGQLDLAGNNNDIAVDPLLGIAMVAADLGGLHIVDVSEPMLPTLVHTIEVNATDVAVSGGFGYASVGDQIVQVDLSNGLAIDRFTTPGGGRIHDMTVAGGFLYTVKLVTANTFVVQKHALDGELDAPAASLQVVGFPPLSAFDLQIAAGNGLVLVGSARRLGPDLSPGVVTLADSPNGFTLSGEPTALPLFDITSNGSGLGVFTGADGVFSQDDIGLLDLSDPTDTSRFLTKFETPGDANQVAVAGGIAFVAASTGFQVVNYLPFDKQGIPPEVEFTTSVAGDEVEEGTRVAVEAKVTDDVQVRRLDLIVNDETVASDVQFPFELDFLVPTLTEASNVTINVRAFDTGGNSSIAEPVTLTILPDSTLPQIVATTPDEFSVIQGVEAISLFTSEAIRGDAVQLGAFTLTDLGDDGVVGGGDDVVLDLADARLLAVSRIAVSTASPLPFGTYRLSVNAAAVVDITGNQMSSDFALTFQSYDVVSDVVRWISDNDGNWSEPTNWNTGVVPVVGDDVVINRLGADPVVTINGGNINVASFASEESVIIDAALTVTGVASFNGPLTIAPDGSLTANGSAAIVTALNVDDFDGSSLLATGGGRIELHGATDYTQTSSADRQFRAEGSGSTITLADLTLLAGPTPFLIQLDVVAVGGGRISLPQIADITGRADPNLFSAADGVQIVADGAGSRVELPLLAQFVDHEGEISDSKLEAIHGGVIDTPSLTTLNGVDLILRGNGTISKDQITSATNARIVADAGAVVNLPALTQIDDASLIAGGGGSLTLPAALQYQSNTEVEDREFRASGANSTLSLPAMTDIAGPVQFLRKLTIISQMGGQIDLAAVTEMTGRADPILFSAADGIQVVADGSGSMIDLASLTQFTDQEGEFADSKLEVTGGGEINSRNLSTLDGVEVVIRGSESIDNDQITSLTRSWIIVDAAANVEFANLVDIDDSGVIVTGGGTLTLPAVSQYVLNTSTEDRQFRSADDDSLLSVPALTTIEGPVDFLRRLEIRAEAGGDIDLPAATQMVGRADPNLFSAADGIWVVSDGNGSLINLAALTQFTDAEGEFADSRLEVTGGGEINSPNLTTLDGVEVRITNNENIDNDQITTLTRGWIIIHAAANVEFANLTDFDHSGLKVTGGGSLTLPALAEYELHTSAENREFRVTGGSSTASLPSLTSILGPTDFLRRLEIVAEAGGQLDLSAVTQITGRADPVLFSAADGVQLVADGAGSMIDLASLSQFTDEEGEFADSKIEAKNSGAINTPTLVALDGVEIVLRNNAAVNVAQINTLKQGWVIVEATTGVEFTNLNDFDHSGFQVSGGGTLTLPALTEYELQTDSENREFRVTGSGSAAMLPALASLQGPTQFLRKLDVISESGGQLDLSALTQLLGRADPNLFSAADGIQLVADGNGSSIDLASLQQFTDVEGEFADSKLEVRGGGTFNLAADIALTGFDIVLSAGNSIATSSIVMHVNSAIIGEGTVIADVTTAGTIAPQSVTEALTIDGNLAFTPTGTLELDLGGTTPITQHDQLVVTATVTLTGTLRVRPTNGFTPQAGQMVDVLAYANHNGQFDTIDGADVTYDADYAADELTLTVAVAGASIRPRGTDPGTAGPGDFNGDQVVDIFDYLLIVGNWGDFGAFDWGGVKPDSRIDQNELDAVLLNWQPTSTEEMPDAKSASTPQRVASEVRGTLLPGMVGPPPEAPGLSAGDFDGDGFVSAGDFNLVRQNWGKSADELPDRWVQKIANPFVGQEELDRVLLFWNQLVPTPAPSPPKSPAAQQHDPSNASQHAKPLPNPLVYDDAHDLLINAGASAARVARQLDGPAILRAGHFWQAAVDQIVAEGLEDVGPSN